MYGKILALISADNSLPLFGAGPDRNFLEEIYTRETKTKFTFAD